ncbi:MAG TPA: NAD(P)/FAD-dependent oxidoreductase, partial [Candidatus Sulfotelmatobacter sp.]|nr:NAD(P)/FAD-dependent oxidoreductase [Candidatus Sulfotelmatobacter sp.]
RWRPGRVEVLAQTLEGARTFEAVRALITLPLGVLQATGAGAVRFEPELEEKRSAIQGLAMGEVVKLVLQFRARFWPVANFGFIHAPAEDLPTWWSDERGPLLTGWTGGPRAERLERQSPEEVLRRALNTVARLFGKEPQQVRELLVAHFRHDWGNDPFARGAYSYTPVGMIEMPQRLGAPIADTLFFAGEATDSSGEEGTVQGALASGRRAAGEMVRSHRNALAGLGNR